MAVALDRVKLLSLFENLAILQTVEWSKGHPSSALAHGLERTMGEKEWEQRRSDLLNVQRMSLENRFPVLNSYGKICEPIGRPEIFIVLGRHHALQPEYYYGITDESPAFAVSQKLKDIRTCTYAILPGFCLSGLPPIVNLNTEELSRLLMFPMGEGPVIAPPNRELFDYLRIWFVPLGEVTPGHYLCKKRPDAP